MTKQLFTALLFWITLTIVGEILAVRFNLSTAARSDKGEDIDAAFRFLIYLSVPVMTMVIAVLISSALLNSHVNLPQEDGPPQFGRGAFPMAWVGVTSCLAVAVMIYPGLIDIPKVMSHEHHPDVLVKVEGVQWTWLVSYPDEHVDSAREIVLPVGATVRFDITSRDVLHSFWIPAFLMKIDAVPGLTTNISLKPTEVGSYQTDPNLRVQCAELCGLSHARMRVPVRVVTRAEYDEWVKANQSGVPGGPTPTGPVQDITITAKNIIFDQDALHANAGAAVHLTVDNQDGGIPHNWALYKNEDAAAGGEAPIAATKIETGPVQQSLTFNVPATGEYYFRCDVHPTAMTGTFTVH